MKGKRTIIAGVIWGTLATVAGILGLSYEWHASINALGAATVTVFRILASTTVGGKPHPKNPWDHGVKPKAYKDPGISDRIVAPIAIASLLLPLLASGGMFAACGGSG
jgi:hypothetical protein